MYSQFARSWSRCILRTAEMVSNYQHSYLVQSYYFLSSSPPLPPPSDMNSCLTEVLLRACVSPALLSERFAMLHAMVVAILHSNIGSEVGEYSL